MLIDWFTVGAQIINFLILVWLLKRFLYQPILNAIDQREQRIARELANADATRLAAQAERDTFARKNALWDQQRSDLLNEATTEVKARRRQMLDAAESDAALLRTTNQAALKRELASLQTELTRQTLDEVYAIARRTLTDLAGVDLEERIVTVFLARLRELTKEAKQTLRDSHVSDSNPAVVRTAFELPFPQTERVQTALAEVFSMAVPVRFEIDAHLASGVELSLDGHKIAWSMDDHLGTLQKSVEELVGDNAGDADQAAERVAP